MRNFTGDPDATRHFSLRTIGDEVLHTEQVIIDAAQNTTVAHAGPLPLPTRKLTFELPDVEAAQVLQREQLNARLGTYDSITNSCLTTACDPLRAGGIEIPEDPQALIGWLIDKKRGE
jgi:hypothetical protein